MVIDEIVAGAGRDDVSAAEAVDCFVSKPARDDVGAGGAKDLQRRGCQAGVDIREVLERRAARSGLIGGVGEIEADAGVEHQRVHAADATVERVLAAVIIDQIVARAADDDIEPTAAVDGVSSRTACDRVGLRRAEDGDRRRDGVRVDVAEI